jgi:hypothetical protein
MDKYRGKMNWNNELKELGDRKVKKEIESVVATQKQITQQKEKRQLANQPSQYIQNSYSYQENEHKKMLTTLIIIAVGVCLCVFIIIFVPSYMAASTIENTAKIITEARKRENDELIQSSEKLLNDVKSSIQQSSKKFVPQTQRQRTTPVDNNFYVVSKEERILSNICMNKIRRMEVEVTTKSCTRDRSNCTSYKEMQKRHSFCEDGY